MDPLSTSSSTNSRSSLVDMEIDVRMAEDADSSDSANIDIGIQESKFWDLPLEIREMIYDMAYKVRLTDLPLPSQRARARMHSPENRNGGTARRGYCQKGFHSPWADMLVSKQWYLEGMSCFFRHGTFFLDTRRLLNLDRRRGCAQGFTSLRYMRNVRVLIGIREGADDLNILRKLCPEIKRLKVIFDRADMFGCHHSIELWPTGEAESSIANELFQFENIRDLEVDMSYVGRKHICAHCQGVISRLAIHVLDRSYEQRSMRASRSLQQC